MQVPRFKSSIKGKIILAFLISLVALAGSYWVNKNAFQEIHKSVEDLSFPNKKLIVVNNIFTEINETEKLFRNLATNDDERLLKAFSKHSKNMILLSDSLGKLCKDNPHQVSLIDSINKLFKVRTHLLLNYAQFRRVLKSNNNVVEQSKLLDSIISVNAPKVDSMVLTNEHKNVITKIDSVEVQAPEEKKGFWKKLFKASKKEPRKIRQIIREEINTKVDTVLHTQNDNVSLQIQKVISDIVEEQKTRRKKFFKHESQLATFENAFNNKITHLLSEINNDILQKTASTSSSAESAFNKSINRIYIIISIFILATAIISFLMLTDITKSNRYKLLLEEANEETERQSLSRQRFLSNMSHEIRTPLQSIIGYTEQINQERIPNKEYVKIIQASSEHLLGVINEILDYNRIVSGIFTFEKINFEISEVIREVIAILKYQAAQKHIELIYEDDKTQVNYLLGDPFRLKQVLVNLIGNAIKFTEKGKVTLSVFKQSNAPNEQYEFRIEDTGIGIPENMLENIFNRFERVSLPSEQRYSGTGLGLGIVRALVEGQNGTVKAKSEPGKGSCFTVHIAYERGAVLAAKQETNSKTYISTTFKGPVWLVDDDRWILNLCHDILNRYKIEHTIFNSAEDLLQYPYEVAPVMIFIDIRMPGMNGLQLLDRLKNTFPITPVFVALTAQALPEERLEISEHGFDYVLLKPFKEQELMSLFRMPVQEKMESFHKNSTTLWDETVLQKMLPKEDVEKVLQHYVFETTTDIELLQQELADGNIEKISALLHRISGRTAQIGAKELGTAFRKLEITIHNHQIIDKVLLAETIEKAKVLMKEIESRL